MAEVRKIVQNCLFVADDEAYKTKKCILHY